MLRRTFLQGVLAVGSMALPVARGAFGAAATAAAFRVDFHSHAWRRASFAADLRQGGLNLAVMVATSDRLLLSRESGRQRALGTVAPGALHANTLEQLQRIAQAIERDALAAVRMPADVARARAAGNPGVLLGCEGADVLEGRLERVAELHAAGVRLLQLVHYRVNELGDIQTEDAVHGGLTPFGVDVLRACNQSGIVVDVAHATLEATQQAAKLTARPLLLSHTFLRDQPRRYTRGVTREHALAVAATGGVVGVVPFPSVFADLQAYSGGIARMVDAVGVNHVGIGGDLAGIRGTPPYRRFEQFPELVEMLRARGFREEETAKIAGENFMRLFDATARPREARIARRGLSGRDFRYASA
jgi:membrane dipeptidase